mmetsp:Transcript_65452/g.182154  ORF Transcript_65452/g.182154 Transcript_65452/m.182154 type:complete len:309 (-) Transcript_65452:1236-2162(-)
MNPASRMTPVQKVANNRRLEKRPLKKLQERRCQLRQKPQTVAKTPKEVKKRKRPQTRAMPLKWDRLGHLLSHRQQRQRGKTMPRKRRPRRIPGPTRSEEEVVLLRGMAPPTESWTEAAMMASGSRSPRPFTARTKAEAPLISQAVRHPRQSTATRLRLTSKKRPATRRLALHVLWKARTMGRKMAKRRKRIEETTRKMTRRPAAHATRCRGISPRTNRTRSGKLQSRPTTPPSPLSASGCPRGSPRVAGTMLAEVGCRIASPARFSGTAITNSMTTPLRDSPRRKSAKSRSWAIPRLISPRTRYHTEV